MKNQEQNTDQFKLKMNLMVQNLLLTSLGMCKFTILHTTHPLSQAIVQFKLFDANHLDEFIERVKNTTIGHTMVLNLADEILIYTAMDISCKAYLTNLGDEMEALNVDRLKNTNSNFSEIRNTVLKGCQFVMQGMRETLSGHPQFDDRVDILENYILV